ncbi:hypothetical protein P7D22_11800 [Lichenihabitans sp. Uapishka_5]|nr:hypothetical protein [Lichenihabitans sp. Uapishka_5]MDX7951853.1 hypothetical protein [Lichenihabitans sp. Uapishka_5]
MFQKEVDLHRCRRKRRRGKEQLRAQNVDLAGERWMKAPPFPIGERRRAVQVTQRPVHAARSTRRRGGRDERAGECDAIAPWKWPHARELDLIGYFEGIADGRLEVLGQQGTSDAGVLAPASLLIKEGIGRLERSIVPEGVGKRLLLLHKEAPFDERPCDGLRLVEGASHQSVQEVKRDAPPDACHPGQQFSILVGQALQSGRHDVVVVLGSERAIGFVLVPGPPPRPRVADYASFVEQGPEGLVDGERVPGRATFDQRDESSDAVDPSGKGRIHEGSGGTVVQRRKREVRDRHRGGARGLDQGTRGERLPIVGVTEGADQAQGFRSGRDEGVKDVARRTIEPLKVVDEEDERLGRIEERSQGAQDRTLGPHPFELSRNVRDRTDRSEDVQGFRDEVDDQPFVPIQ